MERARWDALNSLSESSTQISVTGQLRAGLIAPEVRAARPHTQNGLKTDSDLRTIPVATHALSRAGIALSPWVSVAEGCSCHR